MEQCNKKVVIRDHTGLRLPDRVCTLPKGHDDHHSDGAAFWLNLDKLPYAAPLVDRGD